MARPLLGIALQADRDFLVHNRVLVEERAEVFELAPETLWRAGCVPGPAYDTFLALRERAARPFVGHGVLLSLGAVAPPERRAAWLAALRRDSDAFGFLWLSDHLGFADAGGAHTALPLPLPVTEAATSAVVATLRALAECAPQVAFENNADLFALGDPMAQPAWFGTLCARADAWLVLDLHNAWAHCRNLGLDLDRWLDAVPWDRVLEIHLSGGSDSDPAWLPGGRSLRLDSHDGAVPAAVWDAFERSLPRAPRLRAVVLEWVPDGMTAEQAAAFAADFDRADRVLR